MPLRSTALEFLPNGEVRILDQAVEGSRLVMQNALVNLLTESGEDALYEDRGTDILGVAVSGYITDIRSAQHAANFAAGDLVFFSNAHDRAPEGQKLKDVVLDAALIGGNQLQLDASFEMQDGEVLSYPIETQAIPTS